MSVVCLELFKKHVRADDFADDDMYLEHLLDTAQEAVVTATNRTFTELLDLAPEACRDDARRALVQPARKRKRRADAPGSRHTPGIGQTLS